MAGRSRLRLPWHTRFDQIVDRAQRLAKRQRLRRTTLERLLLCVAVWICGCEPSSEVVFLVLPSTVEAKDAGALPSNLEPVPSDAISTGTGAGQTRSDAGDGQSATDAGDARNATDAGGSTIAVESDPVRVLEEDISIAVGIALKEPARQPLSATFSMLSVTAQSDCQQPDYVPSSGEITWAAGERIAQLELQLADDELAETDELIEVQLHFSNGQTTPPGQGAHILIEDDDRTLLIDAEAAGVGPASTPQDAELQALLDQAAMSGRGVVQLAPGEYVVEQLKLASGTSLSGRGAVFRRPANLATDVVTVELFHTNSERSLPTLVEGLTIDGNREEQGPYDQDEHVAAHLIATSGAVELGGKLVAVAENLSLMSGTGDGVEVGPETDLTACQIEAFNLWRDALSVHGGGVVVDVQEFTAGADYGTTGMAFEGDRVGYEGTRNITFNARDIMLGTGDIEIRSTDGSFFGFTNLQMAAPPFRLQAYDSVVRIADSTLRIGIPTERHNMWVQVEDVRVTNTTLYSSEILDETGQADEQDRVLSQVFVDWDFEHSAEDGPAAGSLVFEDCSFELDDNIEPTDTVYAVQTRGEGSSVQLVHCSLGTGMADWFAPDCSGCIHSSP